MSTPVKATPTPAGSGAGPQGTAPTSEPVRPPAAGKEVGALTPAQIEKARAIGARIAGELSLVAYAEIAAVIRASRMPLPRTA